MKKKPNGKYHIVMMFAGYVEHCTTSCIIYSTQTGERFKTRTEAVKELALDMYHKYMNDVNPPTYGQEKACCAKSKDVATNVFCPKCGRELEKSSTFDDEAFRTFITDLFGTDADSYGESNATAERDLVFVPWDAIDIVGAKENEVVILGECAEDTLAEALYDQMPELMSKEVKEVLDNKLNSDFHQTDWQLLKRVEQ